HADGGPHGPRRRSRCGAGGEALAPAAHHIRHVRESRRIDQSDGGPVSTAFGLMIESLVAVLLLVTIGYCVLLNKRLTHLKANEQTLKTTIAELVAATEGAERAIAGLKQTARDCDQTLGEQLRAAERLSAELPQQIAHAETITNRISRIVGAARPLEDA